ncbi:endonuclease domain-containing protein [Draconibacterium sp. IB214405]|uniref:endonuclease domain-containing protein n=1 Tax=Draconibacterium sp. IB214405 TaxID=3097352 RepID=UPI002A0EF0DC|nr:endonuclease domain-containing protein [Draconibacterium sp. IB214405]MDX8339859.1 endonuclease domain-containing protein [Draconibacterium sp. IB214405]
MRGRVSKENTHFNYILRPKTIPILYEHIKQTTRNLRWNATPAEKKLWRYLRRKQLKGRKFLRQHAIIYESINDEHFFYVPDFYCFKENMAIELDGEIHKYRKKRDELRDVILKNMGIKILRFKNEDLEDIESILQKIAHEFKD